MARSAEQVLATKLLRARVQLTEVKRALGQSNEYTQEVFRAIPISDQWPHAPLDTNELGRQCLKRIRFTTDGETYIAAAADVTSDEPELTNEPGN